MTRRGRADTIAGMTPAEIDREVTEARRQLAEWERAARRDSSSTEMLRQVRPAMDTLACLLDEAPESKRAKINALLDRCEALVAKLLN